MLELLDASAEWAGNKELDDYLVSFSDLKTVIPLTWKQGAGSTPQTLLPAICAHPFIRNMVKSAPKYTGPDPLLARFARIFDGLQGRYIRNAYDEDAYLFIKHWIFYYRMITPREITTFNRTEVPASYNLSPVVIRSLLFKFYATINNEQYVTREDLLLIKEYSKYIWTDLRVNIMVEAILSNDEKRLITYLSEQNDGGLYAAFYNYVIPVIAFDVTENLPNFYIDTVCQTFGVSVIRLWEDVNGINPILQYQLNTAQTLWEDDTIVKRLSGNKIDMFQPMLGFACVADDDRSGSVVSPLYPDSDETITIDNTQSVSTALKLLVLANITPRFNSAFSTPIQKQPNDIVSPIPLWESNSIMDYDGKYIRGVFSIQNQPRHSDERSGIRWLTVIRLLRYLVLAKQKFEKNVEPLSNERLRSYILENYDAFYYFPVKDETYSDVKHPDTVTIAEPFGDLYRPQTQRTRGRFQVDPELTRREQQLHFAKNDIPYKVSNALVFQSWSVSHSVGIVSPNAGLSYIPTDDDYQKKKEENVYEYIKKNPMQITKYTSEPLFPSDEEGYPINVFRRDLYKTHQLPEMSAEEPEIGDFTVEVGQPAPTEVMTNQSEEGPEIIVASEQDIDPERKPMTEEEMESMFEDAPAEEPPAEEPPAVNESTTTTEEIVADIINQNPEGVTIQDIIEEQEPEFLEEGAKTPHPSIKKQSEYNDQMKAIQTAILDVVSKENSTPVTPARPPSKATNLERRVGRRLFPPESTPSDPSVISPVSTLEEAASTVGRVVDVAAKVARGTIMNLEDTLEATPRMLIRLVTATEGAPRTFATEVITGPTVLAADVVALPLAVLDEFGSLLIKSLTSGVTFLSTLGDLFMKYNAVYYSRGWLLVQYDGLFYNLQLAQHTQKAPVIPVSANVSWTQLVNFFGFNNEVERLYNGAAERFQNDLGVDYVYGRGFFAANSQYVEFTPGAYIRDSSIVRTPTRWGTDIYNYIESAIPGLFELIASASTPAKTPTPKEISDKRTALQDEVAFLSKLNPSMVPVINPSLRSSLPPASQDTLSFISIPSPPASLGISSPEASPVVSVETRLQRLKAEKKALQDENERLDREYKIQEELYMNAESVSEENEVDQRVSDLKRRRDANMVKIGTINEEIYKLEGDSDNSDNSEEESELFSNYMEEEDIEGLMKPLTVQQTPVSMPRFQEQQPLSAQAIASNQRLIDNTSKILASLEAMLENSLNRLEVASPQEKPTISLNITKINNELATQQTILNGAKRRLEYAQKQLGPVDEEEEIDYGESDEQEEKQEIPEPEIAPEESVIVESEKEDELIEELDDTAQLLGSQSAITETEDLEGF